jgi:hypothetical protein
MLVLCFVSKDKKTYCRTMKAKNQIRMKYKRVQENKTNPVGVAGIFRRLNTSGRTMVLASTQPLTEMRTRNLRNLSWG